jgi:hypothetical protein
MYAFVIGRSQNGTRVGFLRVLRFPLPILIPLIAQHSLITALYSPDTHSIVK